MYASSLLWSIREVDNAFDDLHGQPRLAGDQATVRCGLRARELLTHLAQLLAATDGIRTVPPYRRYDSELQAVLATMYETGTAEQETLSAYVSEEVATLTSAEQIRTQDGQVIVPLRSHGRAVNWQPTLRLLQTRTEQCQTETKQILDRLTADGFAKESTEYRLFSTIHERLAVLFETLRRTRGQFQLLEYSVHMDEQLDEILATLFVNQQPEPSTQPTFT